MIDQLFERQDRAFTFRLSQNFSFLFDQITLENHFLVNVAKAKSFFELKEKNFLADCIAIIINQNKSEADQLSKIIKEQVFLLDEESIFDSYSDLKDNFEQKMIESRDPKAALLIERLWF